MCEVYITERKKESWLEMTEVYQIQKGDTLTKIAREKYGLNGAEAYQKALEIAQQNGIANPNLIYAGASLNLFGLGEEEKPAAGNEDVQPANAGGDAFVPENQGADGAQGANETENTYKALMEAQKQYMQQFAGIAEENAQEVKEFQFAELSEDNLEADYINGLLDLAEQDIEANDKEDEKGVKDGAISYKEFEAQQLAFQKATFGDMGLSDEEMAQMLGLQDIFNMQDIDGSGALEKNEIAFAYMMADANFDITTFGKNPAINIEDHLEFDGIINFDQQTATAQQLNNDMLTGGKTYSNIYNKVAEMITAGLESRAAVPNAGKEEEPVRVIDNTTEYTQDEINDMLPWYVDTLSTLEFGMYPETALA